MAEDSTTDMKPVINRLRRAQGQLGAVISMVEQGKDCRSVVTQLSAVSMKECIAEDGKPAKDGDVSVEDLEKLFLSLS
ncbi:MAG: metal-sensitive transcriptional regulator [Pontimonas sp.]